MEWDRDAAELGQHPVFFFLFFFFLRQRRPSLSTWTRDVCAFLAIQRGRVEIVFRFILLPGIDGLSFRYFLDRVLASFFSFFPLSENWVVGRWKHGSRNFSKSGRKISGKENSVAMEYFVVRYEIFARVYGQVEHPYPCYIVSFNLDRDLKVYFFFF